MPFLCYFIVIWIFEISEFSWKELLLEVILLFASYHNVLIVLLVYGLIIGEINPAASWNIGYKTIFWLMAQFLKENLL